MEGGFIETDDYIKIESMFHRRHQYRTIPWSVQTKYLMNDISICNLSKYFGGHIDNEHTLASIQKYYLLPWRQDQHYLLSLFLQFIQPENPNKFLTIEAVFGAGKTTMLKSMVVMSLLNNYTIENEEVLLCAFNCSVQFALEKELITFFIKSLN